MCLGCKSNMLVVLEQKYSIDRTLKFLGIFDLHPGHIQFTPTVKHDSMVTSRGCKLDMTRVQVMLCPCCTIFSIIISGDIIFDQINILILNGDQPLIRNFSFINIICLPYFPLPWSLVKTNPSLTIDHILSPSFLVSFVRSWSFILCGL